MVTKIPHQSCGFIFALFWLLFFFVRDRVYSIFIGHISICQWMVCQQEMLAYVDKDFIFSSWLYLYWKEKAKGHWNRNCWIVSKGWLNEMEVINRNNLEIQISGYQQYWLKFMLSFKSPPVPQFASFDFSTVNKLSMWKLKVYGAQGFFTR